MRLILTRGRQQQPAINHRGTPPRRLRHCRRTRTPAYICALAFVAASTNPGPIGREVIAETIRHAPNLQEVVADLGYTAKRTSFVRRLRERGLDVVMDYSSVEVARPKAITAGRQQQPVINHCGTLLPSWVPEALHSPPDGTEPQLCTDVYDQRCRWRYSPHQRLRDGLVTLNSTQLANYQNVPYGTTAWKHSYGRRNQIENTNGRLRHKGALLAGACRSLGRTARAIAALAQAIIYNLALVPESEHDGAATHAGLDQPPEPSRGANTPDGPANLRAPP